MQRILNYENLESKKWNGGVTKEYFKDKINFGIRISSATIIKGESEFSDFTGYKRVLAILKNNTQLVIDGKFIPMKEGSVVEFDGSDKVISKCDEEIIDFNVIWSEKSFYVKLKSMKGDEKITTSDNLFILSLVDNNEIIINSSKISLNKYDGYIDTENSFKTVQATGKSLVVNFIKK